MPHSMRIEVRVFLFEGFGRSMQPICSARSVRGRALFLGASHAVGIALALLAAIFLHLGWRDGLDYLSVHHATASVSWGIVWVALATVGFYGTDRWRGVHKLLAAASTAVLGGMLLATALLRLTPSWSSARGLVFVSAAFALFAV